MHGTADFSECGRFRYSLTRRWSDGPICAFAMLNPSKAGAIESDPTVTRTINYAISWGFGALWVYNIYPYIATDPKDMKKAMRSMDVTGGKIGDDKLREIVKAQLIVVAWGTHATECAVQRFYEITKPAPLWCLGKTKEGKPVHPLYQPAELGAAAVLAVRGGYRRHQKKE